MSKKEEKRTERMPLVETPSSEPFFGQPEDVIDLINKYGTYNIQPTSESENPFPMIAQGLPEQWKDMHVTKEDLEGYE